MTNAILHISDLHFVADYEREGNSRFCETYQMCFFKYLDIELDKNDLLLKYVIVSGDIVNSGEKREFNDVLLFLNALTEKYKLDKQNILICPGNHDITWDNLRKEIDIIKKEDRKEPYLYHEIKFIEFKTFYSNFYNNKKEFLEDKALVDVIINHEDKLLIMGLNSCYKESFKKENHIGFIEPHSLKEKLQEIFKDVRLKKYNKLLVMHHNPEDFKSDKASIDNWYEISMILENNFPAIICGHIHKSKGIGEIRPNENNKYYASVGSFAKDESSIKNSYNLMYKSNEKEHIYKILFIEYENPKDEEPYWQHHDNKSILSEISLYLKTSKEVLEDLPSLSDNTLALPQEVVQIPKQISKSDKIVNTSIKNIQFEDYIDSLILLIQEKKLFKTGHFHWSKDFRSHGIIDINYLISNRESIDLITHLFKLRLKQIFRESVPDLILGIGIEGNVIGARLSILFSKSDYSFIPDTPKDKDFSIFEHRVKKGKFKKIVLIKDLLFQADSLKEILKKEIFKDKDIYVFSLFYCGEVEENDLFLEYNTVKHYSICNKIKINICNHENDISNCPIIKYNLDTYYPLYSIEEK